jgi:hypothetical protein
MSTKISPQRPHVCPQKQTVAVLTMSTPQDFPSWEPGSLHTVPTAFLSLIALFASGKERDQSPSMGHQQPTAVEVG